MSHGRDELRFFRSFLRRVWNLDTNPYAKWVYEGNRMSPLPVSFLKKAWEEDNLVDIERQGLWNPQGTYDTAFGGRTEGRHIPNRQRLLNLLKRTMESDLGDRSFTYDFFLVLTRPWLPVAMKPDQLEAADYHKECDRLQASPAGRKAKKLLLESLDDNQAKDYLRKGYFFVTPPDLKVEDDERRPARRYVIERGYPNGNIMEVEWLQSRGGPWHWYPKSTFCFHSAEPHPTDDILLAQKLVIETDEEHFLSEANRSDPWLKNQPMKHSLRGY